MHQEILSQIDAIIQQNYNPSQQTLDLRNCILWLCVIRLRDWPMLKQLYLQGNCINQQQLLLFVQSVPKQLQKLTLINCQLGPSHIKILSTTRLSNLKQLKLNFNIIGNIGVKWLTKMELYSLCTLWVIECSISAEGLKHMVKAEWPSLKQLLLILPYNNFMQINTIDLNSWQLIHYNKWSQLKTLFMFEKQPICCLTLVTMETKNAKIYSLKIQNYRLFNIIKNILQKRQLY